MPSPKPDPRMGALRFLSTAALAFALGCASAGTLPSDQAPLVVTEDALTQTGNFYLWPDRLDQRMVVGALDSLEANFDSVMFESDGDSGEDRSADAHARQKSAVPDPGSPPVSSPTAASTATRPSALAAATTRAIRSRYACPSRFHAATSTGSRTAFMFHRCWMMRNGGATISHVGTPTPRNTKVIPVESTSVFALT